VAPRAPGGCPQGQAALRRAPPRGQFSLRHGALLLSWGSAALPQLRATGRAGIQVL